MSRVDGAVYMTPRGYVSAEDLTPDEVVELAHTFRLRDAMLLREETFVALVEALGLDVVRVAGVVMGRLQRRVAA